MLSTIPRNRRQQVIALEMLSAAEHQEVAPRMAKADYMGLELEEMEARHQP
jgi:hypothetical protein